MRVLLSAGLILVALFAALPQATGTCNIYRDSSNCIGTDPGSTTLPGVCMAPCEGTQCVLQACITSSTWPAYCVHGDGGGNLWYHFSQCVPV